jgi:hypothetical protein
MDVLQVVPSKPCHRMRRVWQKIRPNKSRDQCFRFLPLNVVIDWKWRNSSDCSYVIHAFFLYLHSFGKFWDEHVWMGNPNLGLFSWNWNLDLKSDPSRHFVILHALVVYSVLGVTACLYDRAVSFKSYRMWKLGWEHSLSLSLTLRYSLKSKCVAFSPVEHWNSIAELCCL